MSSCQMCSVSFVGIVLVNPHETTIHPLNPRAKCHCESYEDGAVQVRQSFIFCFLIAFRFFCSRTSKRIHILNGVINKIQLLIREREREILTISALAFMIVYFKQLYKHVNADSLALYHKSQSGFKAMVGSIKHQWWLTSRVAHKNEAKSL